MPVSLDQFVAQIKEDIEAFAAEYRAQHAVNPENYPIELPNDNAGAWFEQFVMFDGKLTE